MKKVLPESDFETVSNISELPEAEQALLNRAMEAAKHAYAPYSNFYVGAAVQLEGGDIFTANNQENAAYPSGLCAERVLLFNTGANHSDKLIQMLAVVALKNKKIIGATPCGGCRQVMVEYEHKQNSPIRIIMFKEENKILISNNATCLLPFAFDQRSLLNK